MNYSRINLSNENKEREIKIKIKYIKISKYRGLSNVEATFEAGMLSFIGKNDVGKSTALYAIKSFFNKQTVKVCDFYNNGYEPISIEIHFDCEGFDEHTHGNLIKLKKTYTRTLGKDKVECVKEIYSQVEIPNVEEIESYGVKDLKDIVSNLGLDIGIDIKAGTKEEAKKIIKAKLSSYDEGYKWIKNNSVFDEIEQQFPEVVYIPATYDYESQQKTSTETSAFGSLFRVGIKGALRDNQIYKNAEEILSKEINSINEELMKEVQENLNSQISSDKHLIYKNNKLDVIKGYSFDVYVKDGNGNELPLANNGSGLQRAAIIAVLRYQAKIKNPDAKVIYLFEEPEAFLHLQAQKELFYALKDLSDSSQVILTTHSMLFMDSSDIDEVVLLYKDEEGTTKSSQYIDEDYVKAELGEIIRISEIITGKVCCMVEGISDKNAFTNWLKTSGIDCKREGIHFIPMDGCRNSVYYANVKILKDFNIPYVLILDTDNHSKDESKKMKEYIERTIDRSLKYTNRVIVLEGELENYYSIDKVSEVLNIDKNYIDLESYKNDPKEELKKAKDKAIKEGYTRCRKYNENKDSSLISKLMTLEDISNFEEIVNIINKIKECLPKE